MPVSITVGNRFKGAEPEADDSSNPVLDFLWSFVTTVFPHVISIAIGIFLIYLNKTVNDRLEKDNEPVQNKTRSMPEPSLTREAPPIEQEPAAPKEEAAPTPEPAAAAAAPPAEEEIPTEAPVKQAPTPPTPVPEPVSPPRKVLKEAPMLEALMKTAGAPAEVVSITSTQSSRNDTNTPCLKKLFEAFPRAMTNEELVAKVASTLDEFDYGETTLLATSLCCDEVNRVLDEDFHKVYEHHFSMGGLAGFPFGGVTSFGAMAHHIPDGGSCLVVYGPHVGIDSNGQVGMIDRRGRKNNGACCGSAADAANHVAEVRGTNHKQVKPVRPLDAQQAFVRSMLLPYGRRLENAKEATVELPYALYDAMDDMMRQIVTFGSSEVAGEGKIALLGGIQINTPEEHSDYFLPLTFEIRDNHNLLIDNLMWW